MFFNQKLFKSLFFFQEEKQTYSSLLPFIYAMTCIIIASNFLVQFPVQGNLYGIDLHDFLTWGAFSYPFSFLVTDLVNRRYGVALSRLTACAGFFLALIFSLLMPPFLSLFGFDQPSTIARLFRIAAASGLAFLSSQLLDISIFNYFRDKSWWRAPILGTFFGSVVDTALFFSLAFSNFFSFLGPNDVFALQIMTSIQFLGIDIVHWVGWAAADFSIKIIIAIIALIPYRIILSFWLWKKIALH